MSCLFCSTISEGSDLRQYGDAKFGEGRRGRQSLSRMEIKRRSLPDLQGKFGQRREGNGWQDHGVKGRSTVSEPVRAARRIRRHHAGTPDAGVPCMQ